MKLKIQISGFKLFSYRSLYSYYIFLLRFPDDLDKLVICVLTATSFSLRPIFGQRHSVLFKTERMIASRQKQRVVIPPLNDCLMNAEYSRIFQRTLLPIFPVDNIVAFSDALRLFDWMRSSNFQQARFKLFPVKFTSITATLQQLIVTHHVIQL